MFWIGPPSRPSIFFDNGHLQNRRDPRDPDPLPTQNPTLDDRTYYLQQISLAVGAGVAMEIPFVGQLPVKQLQLDDGINAYVHFLLGGGDDRHFDFGEFVSEDPSGAQISRTLSASFRSAADRAYEASIDGLPHQPGEIVRIPLTSHYSRTRSPGFPYPQTENWQKAIGDHAVWTSGEVAVRLGEDGVPQFEVDMTIHAEDRYNFNRGQSDIATGAPDALRGRLEEVGLAHHRRLAEGNKLLAGGDELDAVYRHLEIAESTWHRWLA